MSKVGQEDDESSQTADPNPFIQEKATLLRENKADDNAADKESNGVLLFQSNSGKHTNPQPMLGLITLNREDHEKGASHPQVWLKTVRRKQAAV